LKYYLFREFIFNSFGFMKRTQFILIRLGTVLPAFLILLLLTTCSDALLEPEKKPDHVLLKIDELGMFINGAVDLDFNIVDKRGNPIKNVPAWLDTTVISSKNLVQFKNGKLVAINPGIDEVTIKIGEFTDELSVNITPRLYMTQSVQNY